jgi:hypothetical protein
LPMKLRGAAVARCTSTGISPTWAIADTAETHGDRREHKRGGASAGENGATWRRRGKDGLPKKVAAE